MVIYLIIDGIHMLNMWWSTVSCEMFVCCVFAFFHEDVLNIFIQLFKFFVDFFLFVFFEQFPLQTEE